MQNCSFRFKNASRFYAPEVHPAVARVAMQHDLNRRYRRRWRFHLVDHALGDLLDDIRGRSVIQFSRRDVGKAQLFALAGAESLALGTLDALDVDAVRSMANSSLGGQVNQRAHKDAAPQGLDIPASRLALDLSHRRFAPKDDFHTIATWIQKEMFPSQPIKLVLNKLTLYETQGSFKVHGDSTQAASYLGTLLIECTAATKEAIGPKDGKGCQIVLYEDGAEHRYVLSTDWLAFRSDIELAVSLETDGARMVLHFDIYAEDESITRPHTAGYLPLHPPPASKPSRAPFDEHWEHYLRRIEYSSIHSITTDLNPSFAIPEATQKFVAALLARLEPVDKSKAASDGSAPAPRTVAFLLDRLYYQRSIQPNSLTGVDRGLYRALKAAAPDINILLHPVMYTARHLHRGDGTLNYRIEHTQCLELCPQVDGSSTPSIPKPILFLRRRDASALSYDYLERQDPEEIMTNYFAGAMFITKAREDDLYGAQKNTDSEDTSDGSYYDTESSDSD